MPGCAKNPFWTPRSTGSAFAMLSVRRLIVASVLSDELDAEPPNSNAAASAVSTVAPNSLLLIEVLPFGRVSYRNRQLPLDQPVDVTAQLQELGQLLRGDLIARPAEVDLHDLLHFGGRMGEHDDAIGEIHRLVDVVRDEQDGDAVLLAHAQHEILEVAACLCVDRGERLVHEQDRRLIRQRAGDGHALLHPAGQLPWVVVDESRQADRIEGLLDESRSLAAAQPLVTKRQQHVVADGRPGHQRAAVLLEDERHLLRRLGHSLAAEDRLAARRAQQPCDAFEQRRLPAAGRSDDADELAVLDDERHVAQRLRGFLVGAVRLSEVRDLEHQAWDARQPRCQASTRRSAKRKTTFSRYPSTPMSTIAAHIGVNSN